jgi:hypothetical protein
MRKYILFAIVVFCFSTNFALAQCDCEGKYAEDKEYKIIKDSLTDKKDKAIIDKIAKEEKVGSNHSTLINIVLNKYCKDFFAGLVGSSEELEKIASGFPNKEVNDNNFEECKYKVACMAVKFKLNKTGNKTPEDLGASSLAQQIQKLKNDNVELNSKLSESKKFTSIMATVPYLLSVIGAFLIGIISLILMSYFKNKKIKALENSIEKGNETLKGYEQGTISKAAFDAIESEKRMIEVELRNEKEKTGNLEHQLQLSAQIKTTNTNVTSTPNVGKIENTVRLYAQIPHGDILQKVQDNFIPYESFFEIITDSNKKTGKYRIVNDEETAKYAFDLIDQLKGASYLNGTGKPNGLRQVQQQEGTVEFTGNGWRIVNKMTLTW